MGRTTGSVTVTSSLTTLCTIWNYMIRSNSKKFNVIIQTGILSHDAKHPQNSSHASLSNIGHSSKTINNDPNPPNGKAMLRCVLHAVFFNFKFFGGKLDRILTRQVLSWSKREHSNEFQARHYNKATITLSSVTLKPTDLLTDYWSDLWRLKYFEFLLSWNV